MKNIFFTSLFFALASSSSHATSSPAQKKFDVLVPYNAQQNAPSQDAQKPLTTVECQLLYEQVKDVALALSKVQDALSLEIKKLKPSSSEKVATVNDSLLLLKDIKTVLDELKNKSSNTSSEIIITAGGKDD